MPQNAKIQGALFDLGDTIFNFGKLNTSEIFRKASSLSYNYLKQLHQPAGQLWWYRLRNLTAIRLRNLLSNVTGNDFDSLQVLKKIGKKKGYRLTEQQYLQLHWLWFKPLANTGKTEPDIAQN